MSKKLFIISIIIILVASLAVTFIGCSKKVEEIDVVDAYTQVIKKILNSNEIDSTEPFSGVGSFRAVAAEKKQRNTQLDIGIDVSLNMDLSDTAENADNSFIIELNNHNTADGAKQQLLGLYSDGEFLYLDAGEAKYQFTGFKMYDMLKDAQHKEWQGAADIGGMIAGIMFVKAEISNDDYIFYYDLNVLLGTLEEIFLEEVSIVDLNEFAAMLGFANWSDLRKQIGAISGNIEYKFNGDKFVSSSWNTDSKTQSFKLMTEKFDFLGSAQDIGLAARLEGKEWQTSKLLNMTANGNVVLNSQGQQQAKYDWTVRTNLDVFELITNKGDFKLDEDDMAHIVVTNNIENNSQAYNDSRISATSGVVLEIAYSPKELGTKNIMLAVNPKALLPASIAEDFDLPAIVLKMLPQYMGMHLDTDIIEVLLNGFEGGNGEEVLSSIKKLIVGIVKNGTMPTNFKLENSSDLLDSITKFEDGNIEDLQFKMDSFIFADKENDSYTLKEHFYNVSDLNGGTPKNFGKALGFTPAKESSLLVEQDGTMFTLSDGTAVKKETKLTLEQLNKVIGGKAKYNYTDFFDVKQTAKDPVTIVGYTGLDTTKFDVAQTVRIVTSPADGKNLLSLLLSLNVIPPIPLNVYEVTITLTR